MPNLRSDHLLYCTNQKYLALLPKAPEKLYTWFLDYLDFPNNIDYRLKLRADDHALYDRLTKKYIFYIDQNE